MSRTRNRSRRFSGTTTYRETVPGSPDVVYTAAYTKDVLIASLTDSVGNREGDNPCNHYKIDYTDATFSPPRGSVNQGQTWVQYTNTSVLASWGFSGGPAFEDPDFTSALNQLMSDARGDMPTSVNLLVNAAELAQLRSLVPSLLSGFRALRRKRKQIGKQTAKDLASSHLAYSFGLAPLIRDIGSFLDIRGAVRKRIKELERRSGHTVRISARTPVQSKISTSSYTPYSGGGGIHTAITTWESEVQGVVSARVSGIFVDDLSTRIQLVSSALGITSPLTAAWELIPFSFVIDWFIPVGNAFQALESKIGLKSTIKGLHMTNFVWSIKSRASGTTHTTVTNSAYPQWEHFEYGGVKCRVDTYVRDLGIPGSSLLSSPSGWTVNRSALSISLLIQKIL